MKLTRNQFLVATVALATTVAIGCSNQTKGQRVQLPSGSSVIVTGTGRMYFTGEKAWSLVVKYVTQVPMSDENSLKAQANEFLDLWKVDLEKSGLQSGVIMANQPPKGFIVTTSKSRNFIVRKGPAGTWTLS